MGMCCFHWHDHLMSPISGMNEPLPGLFRKGAEARFCYSARPSNRTDENDVFLVVDTMAKQHACQGPTTLPARQQTL